MIEVECIFKNVECNCSKRQTVKAIRAGEKAGASIDWNEFRRNSGIFCLNRPLDPPQSSERKPSK